MADRHAGYLVTFDDNIHPDDAKAVIGALRMIRGVIAVEPVTANHELVIAKQRVDLEWRRRIAGLLDDTWGA